MRIKFFKSPAEFRAWLEDHHASAAELWVGFYKKDSGKPSITYPAALDEALCFGWIDGVRKSVDEQSYTIRFTPRKPTSTWSLVNVKRVGELTTMGLMKAAGLEAFDRRDPEKSTEYSYENRARKLTGAYQKALKANRKAWDFFRDQAPWYQRTASWWILSAKKEETRQKRLRTLISDSENGRRLGLLTKKGLP